MSEEGLDVPDFMSSRAMRVNDAATMAKGILLEIEQLTGSLIDLEKAIDEHQSVISPTLRGSVPSPAGLSAADKPMEDGSDVSLRIKHQKYKVMYLTAHIQELTNRIDL